MTGVSGSGKSTLVEETLYPALRHQIARDPDAAAPYTELIVNGEVADVVFLDQSPLSRSARSNPVTHLKAFDEIRKTFAATHEAKLRNYDAGRFSFNVEGGRCNACQGHGFLTIDMQFLPDVMIRCPGMSGHALSARNPRGHVPGQEHRRGARPDRARGVRVLSQSPQGAGAAAADARYRARLPAARPARFDALRRRSPAPEAGRVSSPGRRPRSNAPGLRPIRSSCSTSRPPGSIRSTSSSCSRR